MYFTNFYAYLAAVHGAILAPESVRIYTYPEMPDTDQVREFALVHASSI
jgi:hypothetical protein